MYGNSSVRFRSWLMAGCMIAAAQTLPAQAQDVILFKDEAPTADELAEIFFPDRTETATPNIGRTRGIIIHRDPEPQSPVGATAFGEASGGSTSGSTQPATSYAETNTIVGFTINFAFDSANILPDAHPYLDSMGDLLTRQEFADAGMRIVGHTDALGADGYNQSLSEQRAASVRDYLVRNYNVDPNRLVTEGQGESNLLSGYDPSAGENRRVEFQADG